MQPNINIEEIKHYNSQLKLYKEKASKLNAEIEFTNKEIDNICAELSAELGVDVNRNNIQQIYNEQLEKINSALQSGNTILRKIASDEAAGNSDSVEYNSNQTANIPQQIQTPPVAPQTNNITENNNAEPLFNAAPVINTQPVGAPIFTGSAEAPINGQGLFSI